MKTRHLPKHKKAAWFVALRGSYLPVSWQGWLTYIPFIGYLIFSMQVAKNATQSATAAVLIIVPNWVAATIVMTWLARNKS